VAAEERSALLDAEARQFHMPPASEPEVLAGGDPTQKLLTALGRFQRHVARAEAGADQELWSDNCMDELVAAVEISLAENWTEVVEALAGTGRVLQTYEDAGYAHLCVSFLGDSYEILCLMVGDLIVGNVRAGVMQKWRYRYDEAVAEIEAAGLSLVQDDEEEGVEEESYEHAPVPAQIHTIETETAPATEAEETAGPELESEGETAPVAEAQETPEPELAQAQTPQQATVAPEQSSAETTSGEVEVEKPAEDTVPVDDLGIAPEVASALDALCDDLVLFEEVPENDPSPAVAAVREEVATLENHARQTGQERSTELCQAMATLCELAREPTHARDDRFLEVAYGFCEAYVVANTDPNSPVVDNWSAESEELLEAWRQAPVAPEFRPDGRSLQTLLQTAQRAIAEGDVSHAKILALQAAANLAKVETAKAEVSVHEAELRLKEGSEEIDRAREQVKEAELCVVKAGQRMAEGKRACNDIQASVAQILEARKEMEHRIAQLDAQARELQAQREAEVKRMFEAGIQLDEARRTQAQAEAELGTQAEAEQAARVLHEDTRQHIKSLQHKRSEIELALAHVRETLNRHRSSLADIEQAIAEIRGGDAQRQSDSEEMLF